MAIQENSADSNVMPNTATEPRSRKKRLLIVAALLLALGSGGTAWWLLRADVSHAQTKPEPPAPPVFVDLEPLTVNLAGDHVLQASVTLQVASAEDADQLKRYQPVVKSRMLMLLSSKSAEVLQSPQGKQALVAEIADVLKKPYAMQLTPPEVGGVFLTAFVIQ